MRQIRRRFAPVSFVAVVSSLGCGEGPGPDEQSAPIVAALTTDASTPRLIVNAGPDQTVTWPGPVTLVGTVTDDGFLGPGETFGAFWEFVSGPGTLSFAPGSAGLETQVTLFTPGVYVLRLIAHTSVQFSDDITVTVERSDVNQPPLLEPAEPSAVNMVTNGFLGALVGDDGLPDPPAALSITWTQISGPGVASITDPAAPVTPVWFDVAGHYRFRINVTDGALSASGEVSILAHSAAVFDAGPDQTIRFGSDVCLIGSATDDGFPEPAMIFPVWAVAEGPGTVTFSDELSLVTSATFSAPGRYVLLLTGHDGSIRSADDEVVITVEECRNHGHCRDRDNGHGHGNGHGRVRGRGHGNHDHVACP